LQLVPIIAPYFVAIREAAKKNLLLKAGPLRPNHPPLLELDGRWNFGMLEKKVPKKVIFP